MCGAPIHRVHRGKSGWRMVIRQTEGLCDLVPSNMGRNSCDVPGQQVVYLTYDDGIKCEGNTDACNKHRDFLDDLRWLGVKVTLFVNTFNFLQDSAEPPSRHGGSVDIGAEYLRLGHLIGSHTHRHLRLGNLSFEARRPILTPPARFSRSFSISRSSTFGPATCP